MNIHQRIEALGIVVYRTNDMPTLKQGVYYHDTGVILIRPNLTPAREAAILHHEYAHALHGDQFSTPANERRAWREAALLLIDHADYARIEKFTLDPRIIAHELNTTTKIVKSYQEALALRAPITARAIA